MTFIDFRWLDLLDILLVAVLIYQLYHIVKGTVAIRIFIGILAIYLFWKLVEALKMELLSEILGQFIGVGVIALIIVFQQELRRFLLLIGSRRLREIPIVKRLFNWNEEPEHDVDVDAIIRACWNMSQSKTGALIVFERSSDLRFFIESGDVIDGNLSSRLLENIFFKNSPLHDGSVIILKNNIKAARCVLPVTENQEFPAHLGMRHRAAVGITESTDALAIVVSEQTGGVSYAVEGKMKTDISKEDLMKVLRRDLN